MKSQEISEGAVTIEDRRKSLGDWLKKIIERTNPHPGGEIEREFSVLGKKLKDVKTWRDMVRVETEVSQREPTFWGSKKVKDGIVHVNSHFK